MATVKYSRQREAIKNFLMSRKDHPTAEVVYEHVLKAFPNIRHQILRNERLCKPLLLPPARGR